MKMAGCKWNGAPRSFILGVVFLFQLGFGKGRSAYYYARYATTWAGAVEDCSRVGGSLVKFEDEAEMNYFTPFMQYWLVEKSLFWTSLSKLHTNLSYKWPSDSSVPSFNPWRTGEPDEAVFSCSLLTSDRLIDANCTEVYHFICEVDLESSQCPMENIFFSPSHHHNSRNWNLADAICKDGGGRLAKITSEEEQLIADRFRLVLGYKDNDMWLGGTDNETEGVFLWLDGEIVTWPTFISNLQAPVINTSANCMALGEDSQWHVLACESQQDVLCEIDAGRIPTSQACYFYTPDEYLWPDAQQQCQNGGGNLAIFKSIQQFERVRQLALASKLDFHIGMSDPDKTWDFRWIDGSIMLWSRWNPDEPNHYHLQLKEFHGLEPYGMLLGSRLMFNDFLPDRNLSGLCEVSVPLFSRAEVTHNHNSITVSCEQDCYFTDGTHNKTWTCAEAKDLGGGSLCICPGDRWRILGTVSKFPWLDLDLIQDDNETTCSTRIQPLNLPFTFSYDNNLQGIFRVNIMLANSSGLTNSQHAEQIYVFTSVDTSRRDMTCILTPPLLKCKSESREFYICNCQAPCVVYVRVMAVQLEGIHICEIKVL